MTTVAGPGKLDPSRVIAEAFVLPWRRRATFVRALAVPALAIVAMQVGRREISALSLSYRQLAQSG